MSFLLLFRSRLVIAPVSVVRLPGGARKRRTETSSRAQVEKKKERVAERIAAAERRVAERLDSTPGAVRRIVAPNALPALLRAEDISSIARELAGLNDAAVDLQALRRDVQSLIALERLRMELEEWLMFEELVTVLALL